MHLDPAPVSVVNEPYEKGVTQYNKECQEAALAEHAKKLAAAPRSTRFFRWLRRNMCCCLPPSAEEVPPVFTPVQHLPDGLGVALDGTLREIFKLPDRKLPVL